MIIINKIAFDEDNKDLFNYIVPSFHQRQEIYSEGISLIGTIAAIMETSFIKEMYIFNPNLLHGLNTKNISDLRRASILCLAQIISNMRKEFNKYIDEYLKIILNNYSNKRRF